MTRRVQYCGDLSPSHAARNCRECKRIQMAVSRGKTLEEAKASSLAKEPVCRSCRVRFLVKPPQLHEDYNPVEMAAHSVRWLENAALAFDAESGDECFTASDFIAWLKPDIKGHAVSIPEAVGKSIQKGGHAPRHNMADPIPYFKQRYERGRVA